MFICLNKEVKYNVQIKGPNGIKQSEQEQVVGKFKSYKVSQEKSEGKLKNIFSKIGDAQKYVQEKIQSGFNKLERVITGQKNPKKNL